MHARTAGRKVLVPIDGSQAALGPLHHIVERREIARMDVLLLNVLPVIGAGDITRFGSAWKAAEALRAIGEDLMRPAMLLLDAAYVHYSAEVAFGSRAETIIAYARRRDCDAILVDSPLHSMHLSQRVNGPNTARARIAPGGSR